MNPQVLIDFIAKYTGQANVGDTPQNIGQCVGLIEVWTDILGLPHTWGNAVDLLKDADPNAFTVVYNKLGDTTQFPPDGAIVVFGKPYGLLPDGTYAGHTGVSKGSDGNTLRLFQQNDPEGSTPSIKEYTYDACLGWMIPKVATQPDALTVCLQQHDQLVTECNQKDQQITSLNTTIDSLNQTIKDKNSSISSLNQQVSSLESQLTSMTQAKEAAETVAKQVPALQEQLTQAQNDRTSCLSGQETANKTIAQLKLQLAQKLPTGFWNRLKFLLSV